METEECVDSVEGCVIGYLLLYPEQLPIARSEGCSPDWFREAAPKAAWMVIEDRKDRELPTDAAILWQEAGSKIGGDDTHPGVIVARWLRWACPTEVSFRECLGFLRQRWFTAQRARFWGSGKEANAQNDAETEVAASEGIAGMFVPPNEPESLETALNGVPEAILRGDVPDLGLRTEWEAFNEHLGTFQDSEMTVIAARPGGGKSSLLRQVCGYLAISGRKVVLVSVEMGAKEIGLGLAKQLSEVPWKAGMRLTVEQAKRFSEATATVRRLKPFFHILPNMPLRALLAKLDTLMLAEPPPVLIAIDYLQQIDAEKERGETGAQAVGRVSGALKRFAQKWNVPVLAAAQLNRESVKESAPNLEHLRDSGAIEQDADRVIFLHCDKPDPTARRLPMRIIQRKHRNGSEGEITLTFDRWVTKFAQPGT